MQKINRYILSKLIARGGMAEIFLGKHVGDDGFQRIVAVKRILPHYAKEAEFVEMFRDEAHICKRLRHPNIVKVEGFEEVDGSYAIIMEFVDGSDLRSFLGAVEKNQEIRILPIPMCLFIIAEAARGLHYAHETRDEISQKPLEIVHRDISPQNILLSFEGEVKVTDFGIADADKGFKQTETKAGIVKGKYSYMSPEQISAKVVDRRTDVFALCVVLWEMLSMRRLFHAQNEVETIEMVKNCKIPFRLRDLNPDIDQDLEAIVMKGLTKDVKKRYQTGEELEKDLRRYLTKKFSDFSVNDFSQFMKSLLANKRITSTEEIKRTLTTNPVLKVTDSSKMNGQRNVELALDPKANTNFALSKSSTQNLPPAHSGRNNPFATQTTQGRNNYQHTSQKSFSPINYLLAAACLLAMGVGLYFLEPKFNLAKRNQPQVLIRTTPDTMVKIDINGQPYSAGKYLQTPLWVEVPPGAANLKISREGYRDITSRINLQPGMRQKSNRIKLQSTGDFAPTKIYVRGSYDKEVKVSVNSGFMTAVLNQENDFNVYIGDIKRLQTHNISILENNSDKKILSCSFKPTSSEKGSPTLVTIDLIRKKCEQINPRGSS